MAIKPEDIKITINYSNDIYLDELVDGIIAEWILDRQIELYGEEALRVAYPLWIKYKER